MKSKNKKEKFTEKFTVYFEYDDGRKVDMFFGTRKECRAWEHEYIQQTYGGWDNVDFLVGWRANFVMTLGVTPQEVAKAVAINRLCTRNAIYGMISKM